MLKGGCGTARGRAVWGRSARVEVARASWSFLGLGHGVGKASYLWSEYTASIKMVGERAQESGCELETRESHGAWLKEAGAR